MSRAVQRLCVVVICLFCVITSCSTKRKQILNIDDLLPQSLHSLTGVIVHDIYSPPVASRIYAYTTLAYYEGQKFQEPQSVSLTKRLHGFDEMPVPDSGKIYDFTLVAITAFYRTADKFVFSKDSLKIKQQNLLEYFESFLPDDSYNNSIQLGNEIAEVIVKRSLSDNYTKSRGMPRLSVFKEQGKWQQTSPDYSDALEPYWSSISPLLLDSASQMKPRQPIPYSLDKKSKYYKELTEVYNVSKSLSPQQDSIARYWDDNSFVTSHQGHLTFANKKTTPGGHWIGIASILCAQQKVSNVLAARIYALTACSIFDGFIACWDEKYRSNRVRPITVIQEEMNMDWNSLLQTPPFPEYTSGHSVISSAAATILTHYLGDHIAFKDTTEMEYLGMERSFSSINQAAVEAGISRLYGGIHFKSAITEGSWQGKQIGNLYISTFK